MSDLRQRLDGGEVIVLDGAMGTELERRSVPMDVAAWSAAALVTHPDMVREVHEDYIRAGADVITTNTPLLRLGTCWSRRGWGSSSAS
jgi:S-methylmethionine-dependent homocysteine/selenocysteine methylase